MPLTDEFCVELVRVGGCAYLSLPREFHTSHATVRVWAEQDGEMRVDDDDHPPPADLLLSFSVDLALSGMHFRSTRSRIFYRVVLLSVIFGISFTVNLVEVLKGGSLLAFGTQYTICFQLFSS